MFKRLSQSILVWLSKILFTFIFYAGPSILVSQMGVLFINYLSFACVVFVLNFCVFLIFEKQSCTCMNVQVESQKLFGCIALLLCEVCFSQTQKEKEIQT